MRCQYCETDGLHWAKDALGKWRLHYADNSLHLCRVTREKLAKAIKPKQPFWDEKALANWKAKQSKPPPPPKEPFSLSDPWFNFLDAGEQVLAEAIP